MLSYKAGILSYVLAIGMLVSTGLAMLILYFYYSRLEYVGYEQRIRLLENLDVGVKIGLWDHKNMEYHQPSILDLYGRGIDSLEIEKKRWGLFDLFQVRSFQKRVHFEKIFTTAHLPDKYGKSAVYVNNERGIISVVGDTKLTGGCYLPMGGIQSAFIDRVGYTNDQLIYGEELRSDADLPTVSFSDIFTQYRDSIGLEPVELDTFYSFFDGPAILESSRLRLSQKLTGHVVLKSKGRVVLTREAETSNLIVIASVIEFEKGFTGDGQFFATDTIVVRKDVHLHYPSVLGVYNPDEPAQIYIDDGAEVNGWLFMDGEEDGFRRRQIYIEDGGSVAGLIYCNGMVEMYGSVKGNVTTRKFLVSTQRGVYENYLLNAQIDAKALPEGFLTPSQWFYSDSMAVLQYLH